jgi:hypothetical protein
MGFSPIIQVKTLSLSLSLSLSLLQESLHEEYTASLSSVSKREFISPFLSDALERDIP